MTDRIRIPLDHLNSDQYDALCDQLEALRGKLRTVEAELLEVRAVADADGKQLAEVDARCDRYAVELAALRQVARGYCPACGRGDAAPSVADWEQQKQRADQAEAERDGAYRERDGINRMHLTAMGDLGIAANRLDNIRNACDQLHRANVLADGQPHTDRERGVVQAVTRIRAALDGPTRGTAATQATEPTACAAYQPPTTAEMTGLCARCGMYDYRHRPAHADAEQHRDRLATALREALNEYRYCDHDGERCHQTGHVPTSRIAAWWAALNPKEPPST